MMEETKKRKPETFDELKKFAFKVSTHCQTYYPNYKSYSVIHPKEENEGEYSCTNNVYAFVDCHVLYVVPSFDGIIELLSHMKKGSFYVPFAHLDYPLLSRGEWESMQAIAKKWISEDSKRFLAN